MSNDILIFNPSLAAKIGLNEAIIFHQLQYWQNKYGDKWIPKSYAELQDQFPFLSVVTIRRVLQSLIDKEVVKCKRSQSCNAYSVTFASQLSAKMIDQFAQLQMCKLNKTTHKNTNFLSYDKTKQEVGKGVEEKREAIDTIKKLIAIWQRHIAPYQSSRLKLAKPSRNKELLNIFVRRFKADINEWKRFILYITKSKFLMGKVTSFQVSLDWVIIEKNLLRIYQGCYHSEEERREYRSFKKLNVKESMT